ncbi:glutamine synthetase bacteria [Podospora conica]|nr:glutamine synthetase bacteria [Schizothecium conicum]
MSSTELHAFLARYPDVEFIHFHYQTNSGTTASHCVPKGRCISLAAANSPLRVSTLTLIGLCPWKALPNRSISGYDCLHPDWTSLCHLGTGGEASVLCDVSEQDDIFLRCPRRALRQTASLGAETLGLDFLLGVEIEFYLVDAADRLKFEIPAGFRPVQKHAGALLGKPGLCLRQCVSRLQKAGILVEGFHACGGPGQFEIATGPLSPLAAADALVQSLEIIRRCAQDHGLLAVFLPQPFEKAETSGMHMHLSVRRLNAAPVGTEAADSFMAGVLRHLPALAALGMPYEMSYARLQDVAAGRWVAWGLENKDVPVRLIAGDSERMDSVPRWEFRAIDATANIYLAAAGYIAAGILGIQDKAQLTMDNSTEILSTVEPDVLFKRGITTKMPESLDQALDALDAGHSTALRSSIGCQVIASYVANKRGEQMALRDLSRNELLAQMYPLF